MDEAATAFQPEGNLTPYSVRHSLTPALTEDEDRMKKSITPFKNWRKLVKLTQAQVAERFECSTSHVEHLDAGVHRGTGKKVAPTLPERVMMTLIAQKIHVEPWVIDDSSVKMPKVS